MTCCQPYTRRLRWSVAAQALVAGVPAKFFRSLRADEVAWNLTGTKTHQDLTRRCLSTLQEVQPLAQAEANRPSVLAPQVKPLIATRRDGEQISLSF